MTRSSFVVVAGFFVAFSALVCPRAAMAVGEQAAHVRGVVTNSNTGETLEGVTVMATSPALIGPPRTTLTNRRGRYELLSLPPGEYTLSFSYPGTVAATRKVTLLQGGAATLNLDYALQEEEVTTVGITANRQLTRP